jgi:predicted peptidase
LIVFLHGKCEDEDLEKLKHFGPIKYALEHSEFPFIVVAPVTSRGWSVRILGIFLDRIQTRFSVDRDRVYLTGMSMGGHATWALATFSPNRFAAIAPVAGAGNPRAAAQRLGHLPTWIFHGEKDTIVPVKCGLMMVEALKAAGAEVKSTIYPDRGHDSWGPAYDNPELYAWFLKHRRFQGVPPR